MITSELDKQPLSLEESAITPEVDNEPLSLEESIISEVEPEACEAVSNDVNQPLSSISDDTDDVNMEVVDAEGGTYEMIADVESSDDIDETDLISPSHSAEPVLDAVYSQVTPGVTLSGHEFVLTDEGVTGHATEDTDTIHSVEVETEAELEQVDELVEGRVEIPVEIPVEILVEEQIEEQVREPVEDLADEPVAVEELIEIQAEESADEPVKELEKAEAVVLEELVHEPVAELTKEAEAVVFGDPVELISTEDLSVGVTAPTEDKVETDISADVDEISSEAVTVSKESDISDEPKQDTDTSNEDTNIEEFIATESDIAPDTESTEMTSSITEGAIRSACAFHVFLCVACCMIQ